MVRMRNHKGTTRYLREIKKYLMIPSKDRDALLEGLKQEIKEFEMENPGASYETLISIFGEPHTTAQDMMENSGIKKDERKVRIKRNATRVAIVALALLLVALACELISVLSCQEVSVTEIIYEGEARLIEER